MTRPGQNAVTHPLVERQMFLAIGALALVYALLAGLRTASDPDLFWQLATGPWVAQPHSALLVTRSAPVTSKKRQFEIWLR